MIAPAAPPHSFTCGQLVKHRRYGYRGVVVEFDPHCKAPESWYQSNKTRPEKMQPWYHVLVHGATHSTYVAQSNLVPDTTGDPVIHPLVQKIFQTFFRGRYYTQNLN